MHLNRMPKQKVLGSLTLEAASAQRSRRAMRLSSSFSSWGVKEDWYLQYIA